MPYPAIRTRLVAASLAQSFMLAFAWTGGAWSADSEAPFISAPPYQSDALVRGSEPLSKTKDGRMARTVI